MDDSARVTKRRQLTARVEMAAITTVPEPAVVLGVVDSPDEVEVDEAWLEEQRLFLRARLRDFQGRLAANVQRLALAIVEVDDVLPGRYAATVQIDRYVFTEYARPATATFERTSRHDLQFEVAAG
jgi:hypothetical protein